MYCPKCGSHGGEGLNFCRRCGADLVTAPLAPAGGGTLSRRDGGGVGRAPARDPDEMTAEGIGGIIVGDGFFIIGVLLSATHTSISSMLWLLLLLPAFFCFGRGFKDVLHARQIRLRQKQQAALAEPRAPAAELPPPRASVADIIGARASGELLGAPPALGRTTGEL